MRTNQSLLFNDNIFSFSIMEACADFNILEYIECSLCLDIFENPKYLTCLHSFCKTCIDKTLQFNDDDSAEIVCPQCEEQTFIGSTKTTNDLRANFYVESIVDAYNSSKR